MSALVEMASTIGKEIVKGVGGGEPGKGGKLEEIAQHPMMEPVKDVGGAAINAAANIYDGMFEAMVIICIYYLNLLYSWGSRRCIRRGCRIPIWRGGWKGFG